MKLRDELYVFSPRDCADIRCALSQIRTESKKIDGDLRVTMERERMEISLIVMEVNIARIRKILENN